ncbi:hypothetical protein SHDE107825_07530 [Shewanella denitrificans]
MMFREVTVYFLFKKLDVEVSYRYLLFSKSTRVDE